MVAVTKTALVVNISEDTVVQRSRIPVRCFTIPLRRQTAAPYSKTQRKNSPIKGLGLGELGLRLGRLGLGGLRLEGLG